MQEQQQKKQKKCACGRRFTQSIDFPWGPTFLLHLSYWVRNLPTLWENVGPRNCRILDYKSGPGSVLPLTCGEFHSSAEDAENNPFFPFFILFSRFFSESSILSCRSGIKTCTATSPKNILKNSDNLMGIRHGQK